MFFLLRALGVAGDSATRALLLASLPFLVSCPAEPSWAAGQGTIDASGRFSLRLWTADNGLPEVPVTGLAIGPDGTLVFASRSRLVRFDGATLEPMPPSVTEPLHASIGDFWHVGFDGDGGLWVQGRHAVACLADDRGPRHGRRVGRWQIHDVPEGFITCLTFDRDGRPTCVGPGLLLSFDGATFRGRTVAGAPWKYGRFDASSGDLWLWGDDGDGTLVHRVRSPIRRDSPVETETIPGDPTPAVMTMGFGAGGPLALLADGIAIRRADGWQRLPVTIPGIDARLGGKIAESTDGTLWISRHDALLAICDGAVEAVIGGLPGFPQYTMQLVAHGDGGLWATCAGGLLAINRVAGAVVAAPGCTAACVRADGSLIVGCPGAILESSGVGDGLRPRAALPENVVPIALLEDADGAIWVGTQNAFVLRIEGATVTRISKPTAGGSREPVAVSELARDADGRIWAATTVGLAVYDDAVEAFTWVPKFGLESPIRAIGLAADPVGGGVVVALPERGAFRVTSAGASTRLATAEELPARRALAFHRDADDTLWLAGDRGALGLYADGKRLTLSTANGLVDDSIRQIDSDSLGRLWLATRDGRLQGLRRADLRRLTEGRVAMVRGLVLGAEDGFRPTEGRVGVRLQGPEAYRGPAPHLVFPTDDGLVRFLPPSRGVGQRGLAAPALARIEAPAGQTRLRFTPRGMHLTGGPAFQTRLRGIDSEWSAPTPSGHREYGPLPPGAYRFECRLVDGETDADFPTSSLPIEVPPPWWRRPWVLALGLLLIAAGSALAFHGLIHVRARRSIAQLELQRERERERARIARDIHDNLGAGLTRLALMSENASRCDHGSRDMRQRLDAIYCDAQSLARSVDEIVWAVNPVNDNLTAFASFAMQEVEDFARAAGLAVRLDVERDLPDVGIEPDIRHHLFLAIREGVQNVVRHARASRIDFTIRLDAESLEVVIQDDGRGFDTAASGREGQDGLHNMRTRMRSLGGRIDIRSAPGSGTRVTLAVAIARPGGGTLPTYATVAAPARTLDPVGGRS